MKSLEGLYMVENNEYSRFSALMHVHREAPHLVSWEEVDHARDRLESAISEQRTDIRKIAGMYTIIASQREHTQSDERVGS